MVFVQFGLGLTQYLRYPIHSNPRHSQTFVYMNLAITLIFDLGLGDEFPNPMSFTPVDTKGLVEGGAFTKAAKQAYLGCYCLSSAWVLVCHCVTCLRLTTIDRLSMGFQKPNSIQYRNLMDSRGVELLKEEALSEIHHIVKLQRLWERISEFHLGRDQDVVTQPSSFNSEMEVQMFLNELEDLRKTASDVVRNIGVSP